MEDKLHGYMTVEAALLMPMVWFSLFFFIFMGFFQYDRCIAEQDSKAALLRAVGMREKEEEAVKQAVLEKGELLGKKKLLFSGSVQKELRITNGKAKMKVSGKVDTIWNILLKEAAIPVFSYGAEYEAKKYDPVQVIRVCRRIKEHAGN